MCRSIVVSLMLLSLTTSLAAKEIFVNNLAGDDRNNGAAPETLSSDAGPVRTISRALREAEKGDRIIIANTGQPYRECITLQAGRHSGFSDRPFVLEGNGAVLEGAAPVPDEAWEHVDDDIFRFQPPRMAFQQLFREGLPLERVAVVSPFDFPPLESLQWCLHQGHVYFRAEAGRLPQQYALTHSLEVVGITMYDVRHVEIRDLTVQGYQLDGVNCHSNVFVTTLVGLTCRGNGRSGVSIGGASRVTLAASLLGNNGEAQLRVEGYAEVVTANNTLLDNTAPATVLETGRILPLEPAAPAAAGN